MCTDMCHGQMDQCTPMETYDSQAEKKRCDAKRNPMQVITSKCGETDGTTTAPYTSKWRPANETNTRHKHAQNTPAPENCPRAQTDYMPNPAACAHDRPAVCINNNRCEPRHRLRQRPNHNPNPKHAKLGILLLTESASN